MSDTTTQVAVDAKGTAPAAVSGAVRAGAHLMAVSVRFVGFSATTSSRAFEKLPGKIRSRIGFTLPGVTLADSAVVMRTTFLFRVNATEQETDEPLVDLRAVTELVYRRKPDSEISEPDLADFARLNAPLHAWPYWREFVQSAFARLGLPPFPLPLLRVGDVERMIVNDPPKG